MTWTCRPLSANVATSSLRGTARQAAMLLTRRLRRATHGGSPGLQAGESFLRIGLQPWPADPRKSSRKAKDSGHRNTAVPQLCSAGVSLAAVWHIATGFRAASGTHDLTTYLALPYT